MSRCDCEMCRKPSMKDDSAALPEDKWVLRALELIEQLGRPYGPIGRDIDRILGLEIW